VPSLGVAVDATQREQQVRLVQDDARAAVVARVVLAAVVDEDNGGAGVPR
jgi:hypothetical protein